MNDLELKTHIQKLIEPLYSKIQYLEKENSDLKKRVDVLETQIMTQSTRAYMKNTGTFFIYVQPPGSTISCKALFLDVKMITDLSRVERKDLPGNLTLKFSNPNQFQNVFTF